MSNKKQNQIKASDLRIGNLVLDGKDIEQVNARMLDMLVKLEADFDPIPLTEEWLLRFGFVYHDDDGIITYSSRDNIVIFQRYRLDFYFELSNYKDAELEYVHQLQNLYHALTGEELTYE
jgi:hypothetical protein